MRFLIGFFFRNGLASRRTVWLSLLALAPIGFAMLFRALAPRFGEGATAWDIYPGFSLAMYLHLLLPLMALFTGTGVITDEVEERTLPYLLTRPIPRRDIVVSKLLAALLTIGPLLALSHLATFAVFVTTASSGGWSANAGTFWQATGVLLLGSLSYLGLFAFFGGFIKRPVIIGLLFTFGWESTVALFPGNVKLLTVAHYLHVLYPGLMVGGGSDPLAYLMEQVIPVREISDPGAVVVLLGIAALFGAVTAALPYLKEYRLEQTD